jgi:outer membrane protein OmpA-like peptidoglycan-associated protein
MKRSTYRLKNTPSVQTKAETPFFNHHSEQEQPFFAPKESAQNTSFSSNSSVAHSNSLIQTKTDEPKIQRDILGDIGNTMGDMFNTRDNEAQLDLEEDIADFTSHDYGPITYRRPESEISGSGFEARYSPTSQLLNVTVRAALRFADTLVGGSGGYSSPNHFMNIGGFMPIMNSLPPEVQAQILPSFQWNDNDKQIALIRFRENINAVMGVWENTNMRFQVDEVGWEGIVATPDINISVREGDAVTNRRGLFNLVLDQETSDHLQIEIVKQPSAAEIANVTTIISNHNAGIGSTLNNGMIGGVRSYLGNDPNADRSSQAGGAFNNFLSLESDRSDDPSDRSFSHTVFYEHNSAELSPDQQVQLSTFLENPILLLDNSGRNINISLSGYASHRGSSDYNSALVERRLTHVKEIIERQKISSALNTNVYQSNDSNDSDTAAEAAVLNDPTTYDEAQYRKVDILVERQGRGGQNVLAHEFGHVFGLGDEYAEVGNGSNRPAHTEENPSLATHSPLSEAAGAGQATVGTDSTRIMDAGNRVDAPHYSTFADALNQLTDKSWKIITP